MLSDLLVKIRPEEKLMVPYWYFFKICDLTNLLRYRAPRLDKVNHFKVCNRSLNKTIVGYSHSQKINIIQDFDLASV